MVVDIRDSTPRVRDTLVSCGLPSEALIIANEYAVSVSRAATVPLARLLMRWKRVKMA